MNFTWLGRGLAIIWWGAIGYLVGVFILGILGYFFLQGEVHQEALIKWGRLITAIPYLVALSFAWFFAGRRYWKQSKRQP